MNDVHVYYYDDCENCADMDGIGDDQLDQDTSTSEAHADDDALREQVIGIVGVGAAAVL